MTYKWVTGWTGQSKKRVKKKSKNGQNSRETTKNNSAQSYQFHV